MPYDLTADIAIFFDPGNLGIEAITYTPSVGSPRTVYGYVNRSPIRVTEHGGKKFSQKEVDVELARSATLGVLIPKFGFDTITVKEHLGGSDKTYTVTMPVAEREGENPLSWVLECRA